MASFVKNVPSGNGQFGWAVSHPCGNEMVHLLFSDETNPEMTPGEHRFRAVDFAITLIYDGSVYPDDITVTHIAGSQGNFAHTGIKAIAAITNDLDYQQLTPEYWESIR